MCRASSFNRAVAGLQAVESESCSIIQNIDVTGIVGGHWDYRPKLGELVKLVGLSSGKLPPPSLIANMVPSITGTLPPVPYLTDVAKIVQDQAAKAGSVVSMHGPGRQSNDSPLVASPEASLHEKTGENKST